MKSRGRDAYSQEQLVVFDNARLRVETCLPQIEKRVTELTQGTCLEASVRPDRTHWLTLTVTTIKDDNRRPILPINDVHGRGRSALVLREMTDSEAQLASNLANQVATEFQFRPHRIIEKGCEREETGDTPPVLVYMFRPVELDNPQPKATNDFSGFRKITLSSEKK